MMIKLPNKLTSWKSFLGAFAYHVSVGTLEGCDKPRSDRLKYKRTFIGSDFGNARRWLLGISQSQGETTVISVILLFPIGFLLRQASLTWWGGGSDPQQQGKSPSFPSGPGKVQLQPWLAGLGTAPLPGPVPVQGSEVLLLHRPWSQGWSQPETKNGWRVGRGCSPKADGFCVVEVKRHGRQQGKKNTGDPAPGNKSNYFYVLTK